MVRNSPILAATTLLVGTVLLWHTDRNTAPVAASQDGGVSVTTSTPPTGPYPRANRERFGPLPRQAETAPNLYFSRDSNADPGGRNPPGAAATREAPVGHHLIPPGVRRMTSAELRERLAPEMRARLARYERDLGNFEPEHRRYFCWGPDTPPEVVEAFRRVEVAAGLAPGPVRALAFQFVGGGHWTRTATDGNGVGVQGLPVTVTWSIVPDGTTTPGDGDPDAPSNLIAWLDSLYPGTITADLTQRAWFSFFVEAMADLSAQCGINLVYEPNDDSVEIAPTPQARGSIDTRGDIRIAARDIDGNGGTLAFAYSPSFGDIVLESFDNYYTNTTNNSRRLVNVLTHEIGHSLGLGHVCPINQTKLMEPTINTSFRGTRFDETYSLQRQYADELEVHSGGTTNDSATNATPVTLATGSLSTWSYLSIDDNSDVDYFAFTAAAGDSITVRAIPSDPIAPGDPNTDTYLEGEQLSDGSCSAGTPFDPTSQQNLTVEVLDTNGSAVLAVANGQPAGETEELLEVPLPADGTYYLRINGGIANSSQLYELQAELKDGVIPALVNLGNLSTIYNGSPQGASLTTDPAGLAVTVTYGGSTAVPTDAGTYAVSATVTEPGYTGSAGASLVIAKAAAGITPSELDVLYDGAPKPVEVTTEPTGLGFAATYDDTATAPSAVGSYDVVVSIDDSNYEGTAGGTLVIGASFLSWGEGFSLPAPDPFVDDDKDGWLSIAEYLFDTNPADRLSAPLLGTSLDATTFSLLTPSPVSRPDAVVRGETSADLLQWTTEGVSATGTGFSVPRAGPSRYLRLKFTYGSE